MGKEKTILFIEDEPETRKIGRIALSGRGYRVLEADTVESGLHQLFEHAPDLVIVDVSLPDGTGLDICRKIRTNEALRATPVVALTGRSELKDKLSGFEAGVDQYLIKPLDPQELVGWIDALLTRVRYQEGRGGELQAGELSIDASSQLVRFRDQPLPGLTPKEFDLLYALVRNSPRVLSRQYILGKVWRTVAVDNVVDTHLYHLRKKLPPGVAERIQAIPGRGFRYFDAS